MNALTTLRDSALRRRDAYEEDSQQEKSLVGQALNTALAPVRIATSRPAIKAYLTALLFFLTSFVLISISTTAYLVFYYNYIPQIGLKQTIYLQYDVRAHPHATVAIDTAALTTQQPYEVSVSLHMPRTPANLAAGNFMVDLSLLPDPAASAGPLSFLYNSTTDPATALAHSRRPAILPYKSHITSLSHKLLQLPVHLLSLKDLDATVLDVPLFERLSFPRGRSNIPTRAYLEIQSQTPPTGCPPPSQPVIGLHVLSQSAPSVATALQIYSAELHFQARFEGLRYYVYNYRTISFLVFTSLFYTFAITSMAVAWAFISAFIATRTPESSLPKTLRVTGRVKAEDSVTSSGQSPKIKTEPGETEATSDIKSEDDSDLDAQQLDSRALADLSSTERTFPTLGRTAQPLRYTPSSTTAPSEDAEAADPIQRDDLTHDAEDEEEDDNDPETRGRIIAPISGATQDVKPEDDDDDDVFRGDSGIGTSMESEARASGSGIGLVRRRSRGGSRARGS